MKVSPATRDLLILTVFFGLSRAALWALGLRFNLILDWMFLADPEALQQRLWETVWWFHAYPPGMNILTGGLLKLDAAHLMGWAQVLFWGMGWLLIQCMYVLARAVGTSRGWALGMAVAFSVIPASLYLENLYLYDYLAAALLGCAAVFLYQAVRSKRTRWWLGFFAVCAALAIVRSTFHLLWFAVLVAGSVGVQRNAWKAALVPGLVLVGLYAKNAVLFGVFGATSWAGANWVALTTAQLPGEERAAWMAEGKLSPYAQLSVFAPPRAYLPLLAEGEVSRGPAELPAVLGSLERPTLGTGNFNHWLYLDVNRQRAQDAWTYIRERPQSYLTAVLTKSLPQFFGPTTRWHPHDNGRPTSPHYGHALVLGRYERFYNLGVHPFPGGIYSVLPFVLLMQIYTLARGGRALSARTVLLVFALFQVGYMVTLSSVFTLGECARYRYLVEGMIWILTARAILDCRAWVLGPRRGMSNPNGAVESLSSGV